MPVPDSLLADGIADRLIVSPIKRHDIWKMYKQMLASFWTVEEVDLSQDRADFLSLSMPAQQVITNVLAFFAIADGIVVENLADNFCKEMTAQEATFAYTTQAFMETIHSEMYSALLETIVPDTDERSKTITMAVVSPHIVNKTAFCQKYMSEDVDFGERLVAFCVVEGVLFSSSFAFIYWLKTKGKMPGLCFSNELIARDEGMHRDLGVLLFTNYLGESRPEAHKVHEIVSEAVKLEQSFVKTSMSIGLLGLSTDDMCQYVEFIADHLLTSMNVDKLYNKPNPLDFMELLSLQGKTNFFEKRVGEYQKTNVGNTDANRFKLVDFGKGDFDS